MTAPETYQVTLTSQAQRDLDAIVGWIVENDSVRAAEHVLDKLLATCHKLAQQPERGAFPPELLALGIRRYRQVFFKPYRVVYRVLDHRVAVLLIADGRRNLKATLERRLLGG
ncbi:MAG: plasmid stabilization protein [Burkholderiales bacterium PBB5]|nr:MAG: plasmid stabilization protein [Burkholderiales bacterium PBB5]